MTHYVALLRAINLGAHNKVSMAALRDLLRTLGLENVESFLQSGNLVFTSTRRSPGRLEGSLERAAQERLGLETDILVRSAREWAGLVADNPLPEAAERDPSHLVVMVLKKAPTAAGLTSLQGAIGGRETVMPGERHLYLYYPEGIGRSKLTTALIEERLGIRGTGRNWNTVLKVASRLQP